MEQLIEILIRLIAALFENPKVRQAPPRSTTPPGYQGTPAAPGRIEPSNRAVMTKNMPTAARAIRRTPQQLVAVARPIVTGRQPGPPVVPTPPAAPVAAAVKAVAAKPITSAKTIAPQSAAAIRKWMTPATLRQQFILTEIFQPPLALRDPPKS